MTGAPAIVVLAAIASTAWDNLLKGQLVPIVFCAVAVAGWALGRGRRRFGAIAAAATMLEPHIGLPMCVAAFLWVPTTRVVLIISGLALAGGIALLIVGANKRGT